MKFTTRKYHEVPFIIESLDREFSRLITEFSKVLLGFSGSFNELSKQFSTLLSTANFQQSKTAKAGSNIFLLFPSLVSTHLLNIPIFDGVRDAISAFIKTELLPKKDEFHLAGQTLQSQFKETIEIFDSLQSVYNTSYEEYTRAGKVFQEANRSDPLYSEIKSAMIERRIASIKAYNELQEKLPEINEQFEKHMTEFEKLEHKGITQLQEMMLNISDMLKDIGKKFSQDPNALDEFLNSLEDSVINMPADFVDPLSDDLFRIGAIPPEICTILMAGDLFPDEMKSGKMIYIATDDHRPSYDELSAIKGEFFVLVEEDEGGKRCKCRNINGSIGFLPLQVLKLIT